MCKILAITGPLKRTAAERALSAAATIFSRSQRDGFGFVAHGKSGTGWGRYLRPEMFGGFGFAQSLPQFLVRDILEEGAFPDTSQVLLAHGRTSTNHTSVHNVHPFRNKSTYIIHNGILDWRGSKKTRPASSWGCDTEEFLNYLAAGNELYDAHKHWSGYGAIFLLDTKSGKVTLAKCSISKLYGAARSKTGWVFSTEPEDLLRVARAANISLRTRPIPFPAQLVFFAPDGSIAKHDNWGGFASRTWDSLATQSLGGKPSHVRVVGKADLLPFAAAGVEPEGEPDEHYEIGEGYAGAK